MNGRLPPIMEPPMNPATAPMAASGTTYPGISVAAGVFSPAMTGHSVFGVRQIFFTRLTISMRGPPEGAKGMAMILTPIARNRTAFGAGAVFTDIRTLFVIERRDAETPRVVGGRGRAASEGVGWLP